MKAEDRQIIAFPRIYGRWEVAAAAAGTVLVMMVSWLPDDNKFLAFLILKKKQALNIGIYREI